MATSSSSAGSASSPLSSTSNCEIVIDFLKKVNQQHREASQSDGGGDGERSASCRDDHISRKSINSGYETVDVTLPLSSSSSSLSLSGATTTSTTTTTTRTSRMTDDDDHDGLISSQQQQQQHRDRHRQHPDRYSVVVPFATDRRLADDEITYNPRSPQVSFSPSTLVPLDELQPLQNWLRNFVINYTLHQSRWSSRVAPERLLYACGLEGSGRLTTTTLACKEARVNLLLVRRGYQEPSYVIEVYERALTLQPCLIYWDDADYICTDSRYANDLHAFIDARLNERLSNVWTVISGVTNPRFFPATMKAMLAKYGRALRVPTVDDVQRREMVICGQLRAISRLPEYPEMTSDWQSVIQMIVSYSYMCSLREIEMFLRTVFCFHYVQHCGGFPDAKTMRDALDLVPMISDTNRRRTLASGRRSFNFVDQKGNRPNVITEYQKSAHDWEEYQLTEPHFLQRLESTVSFSSSSASFSPSPPLSSSSSSYYHPYTPARIDFNLSRYSSSSLPLSPREERRDQERRRLQQMSETAAQRYESGMGNDRGLYDDDYLLRIVNAHQPSVSHPPLPPPPPQPSQLPPHIETITITPDYTGLTSPTSSSSSSSLMSSSSSSSSSSSYNSLLPAFVSSPTRKKRLAAEKPRTVSPPIREHLPLPPAPPPPPPPPPVLLISPSSTTTNSMRAKKSRSSSHEKDTSRSSSSSSSSSKHNGNPNAWYLHLPSRPRTQHHASLTASLREEQERTRRSR